MSTIYIRDKNGNFVQLPTIPGKSAYEIAVEKGVFSGTELEFAQQQVFSNKEILESITQDQIDTWNSAKGMTDEEKIALSKKFDDVELNTEETNENQTALDFYASGEVVKTVYFSGGGGGTDAPPYISTIISENNILPVGETFNLQLDFSSTVTGRGTAKIFINDVEVISKSIPQGENTIPIEEKYFAKGTNRVIVYVIDRTGVMSNSLTFYVRYGSLEIASDFDAYTAYDYGAIVRYYFTPTSVDTSLTLTMYMSIDGEVKPGVICTSDTRGYYTFPSDLGVGAHYCQAYIKDSAGNTSNILSFNLIILDDTSLVVASDTINPSLEEGSQLALDYKVYMKNNNSFITKTYVDNALVGTGTCGLETAYYKSSSLSEGIHTIKIEVYDVTETVSDYIIWTVTITPSTYTMLEPVTAGALFIATTQNMTNASENKEVWVGKDQDGTSINATLNNFAFNSESGWVNDELLITGASSVEVPVAPLANNARYGFTLDLEFASKMIGVEDALVLNLWDDTKDCGIKITTEKVILRSAEGNQCDLYFTDDEMTSVIFVIDRNEATAKIYLNGVMCSAFHLSDYSVDGVPYLEDFTVNSNITLGGSGHARIRNLRVYQIALTTNEILNNFMANERDKGKQRELVEFQKGEHLPTLTIYCDFSGLGKDDKKPCSITYVSTDEEKYGKSFALTHKKSTCQYQGTSSMAYPIKNYRINLADADGNKLKYEFPFGKPEHRYTLKADFMSSGHWTNTGLTKWINNNLYNYDEDDEKSMNPKKWYDINNGGKLNDTRECIYGFPCRLILVNDGNTPLNEGQNEPTPGNTKDMGIFNFNHDKDATDTMGFDDDAFPNCASYEVTANSDTSAGAFISYINSKNIFKHENAFDSSATNDVNLPCEIQTYNDEKVYRISGSMPTNSSFKILNCFKENTVYTLQFDYINPDPDSIGWAMVYIRYTDGTAKSLQYKNIVDPVITSDANKTIELIYFTNPYSLYIYADSILLVEGEMPEEGGAEELEYIKQSFELRFPDEDDVPEGWGFMEIPGEEGTGLKALIDWVDNCTDEEFVRDFEQHFHKDYTLRYFLLVITLGMVDNLGKNMMLDTWDNKIFMPRFYDCDTICSYDNSGQLKFDVDIEMAQGYWNTSTSRLWTRIRDLMHDDLVAKYNNMRQNGLSYESLMQCFYDEQIAKIPQKYYNMDYDVKYAPFADSYLGMANGDTYEHLKRWLKNRLIFVDTLYDYAPSYNNDMLTIRANTTEPMTIYIETYTPVYQHLSWYNGQMDKKKIDGKVAVEFTGTAMAATDQEVLIYGGTNVKKITGISSMNPNRMLIGSATRLIELDAHDCPLLSDINANKSNLAPHVYLNKVNLSGCPLLGGNLIINNSPLVREIDIRGTGIAGLNLPSNLRNLEVLKLPSAIKTLNLNDAGQLHTLEFESGSEMETVSMTNCNALTNVVNFDLENVANVTLNNSYNIANELYFSKTTNLSLRNMSNLERVIYLPNAEYEVFDKANVDNASDYKVSVFNSPKCNTFMVTAPYRESYMVDYETEKVYAGESRTILDCVISNGTQYIITDYYMKTNTKIVAELQMTPETRYDYWMGTDNFKVQFGDASGGSMSNTNVVMSPNTNYTSRQVWTFTTSEAGVSALPLHIFCGYYQGNLESSFMGIGSIYSFQIYEDTELVRDYEPCMDADGVACLYDKISDTFLYAQTPLIAGNVVNVVVGGYMDVIHKNHGEVKPDEVFIANSIDISDTRFTDVKLLATTDTNILKLPSTTKNIIVDSAYDLDTEYLTDGDYDTIHTDLYEPYNTDYEDVVNIFIKEKILKNLDKSIDFTDNYTEYLEVMPGTEVYITNTNIDNASNSQIRIYEYDKDKVEITSSGKWGHLLGEANAWVLGETTRYIRVFMATTGTFTLNYYAKVLKTKSEILYYAVNDSKYISKETSGAYIGTTELIKAKGKCSVSYQYGGELHLFDKDKNKLLAKSIAQLTKETIDGVSVVSWVMEELNPNAVYFQLLLQYTNIAPRTIWISDDYTPNIIPSASDGSLIFAMYAPSMTDEPDSGVWDMAGLDIETIHTFGLNNDIVQDSEGKITMPNRYDDYAYQVDNLRLPNEILRYTASAANVFPTFRAEAEFQYDSIVTLKDDLYEHIIIAKDPNNLPFSISFGSSGTVRDYFITVDYIDTSSCKNLESMFYFCSKLVSVNLTDCDISKVTSMNYMFQGCVSLEHIIGLNALDTSNVTAMNGMFVNCNKLLSLDVSNFDTAKVTGMGSMFFNCNALTSLDVSNFNTTNVTNMADMFQGCNNLTSLDLSNFDTSKVTGMNGMFGNCSTLTSLDLSNFNTTNVTNMNAMFQNCSTLTSLDLSNFNTSNVKTMSGTFQGCSTLTSLDISGFDTSNVTTMYGMFQSCSALTSLDLSNFNTQNVTNMGYTFFACRALTSLDLSYFDVSKVTNMFAMLDGCNALMSLNVTGWPNNDYTQAAISSLPVGDDAMNEIYATQSFNVKTGWTLINLLDAVVYTASMSGTVPSFNAEFTYSSTEVDNGDGTYTVRITADSLDNLPTTILMHYTTGIQGINTLLSVDQCNCSNLTTASNMFLNCGALTKVKLIGLTKVTSAYSMFSGCKNLTSLDVSDFNTSNVTTMEYMFYDCNALTSLDVSNFDTSKVTNMNNMFSGCKALTSLDVSNFNTSNVTTMNSMFYNCNALTSLDVSNFDTSNVKNLYSMFNSCSNLTSLDLSNFDTSKVTSMYGVFQNCYALTSLNVSNFDTPNVTNMYAMFQNCYALTSLDVSNFDTTNVTNMGNMFYDCRVLTSLDVSNFNTTNTTNMNSMFRGCSNLTSLDLSAFDTSKVTNMANMFAYCSILERLKGNFVLNTVGCASMFQHCLKGPDLSEFKMSGTVNDTNYMFNSFGFGNTPFATSLDLSDIALAEGCTITGYTFFRCTVLNVYPFTNINTACHLANFSEINSEVLLRFLNNLANAPEGVTWTLTLGNVLINKLTEEQIAIAVNKGWTVA